MTQNSRPGAGHRPENGSAASPVATPRRRRPDTPRYVRPLLGLATICTVVTVIAVAAGFFRGDFTRSVPVTVLSPRAGLVMNPDADVKMRGVRVGKVDSIEPLPNGQAALHLAMEPAQLHLVPENTLVNISSTTVFGGKSVELVPPDDPSPQPVHAGQVLDSTHVVVETNTIFQQLTSVLSTIDPAKLSETLGAIASAMNGRGHKIGQMVDDLDAFLATLEPTLPTLSHEFETLPSVANAYADAAPDLMATAQSATRISDSIVDEQKNLDAFLISSIGLADTGNEVLGANRQALTDVLQLLVPTTNLTNEYHEAITCGIKGSTVLLHAPAFPDPGLTAIITVGLGAERYRYPVNLPKVAATGGPQCNGLPVLPPGKAAPFVVTDVGANPWQYGNPQVLINSDGLKQLLYGPLDGPPRNSLQIGQPG